MIVEPETLEVKSWHGLHLFHFGMSNCSQRVRIMLEEKELPWEGHVIDIPRGDNLTEFYQGINPNAVVPTLVHDGVVHIESTDILAYLDGLPSGKPSLMAGEDIDAAARDELIERAAAAQRHIKLLSFEYLFKPVARKGKKEIAELDGKLRNQELLNFHKRFNAQDGFSRDDLWLSVCGMHEYLEYLELRLSLHPWLAGERISIADVAWVVNVHRLRLMHFPLGRYPALETWYARVRRRPSYERALKAFEPGAAVGVVRLYSWWRARFGSAAFAHAPC